MLLNPAELPLRRAGPSAAALVAIFAMAPALAQRVAGPPRFVDLVGVQVEDDHADVTVLFDCSVRYLTHLPASEGTELRIELQPLSDCGGLARSPLTSELPPISDDAHVVRSARVETDVPGQIALVLSFGKSERFVLAQGIDPRGLRIRLYERSRGRAGVVVSQPGATVSYFAINLDSEPRAFDQAALERAHALLKVPVFVSATVVNGEKWFRLRAGPIENHSDAERLLDLALPNYPRAWIAIGDDALTSNPEAATADHLLPSVQPIGADPPLDPAALKRLVADAEQAFAARDYPNAIRTLTKLQRQPEFPERAHAQELLGLARERSGQFAQAQAEYQEYLRRYPHGPAAERVALRLRMLREATERPRTATGPLAPTSPWKIAGGVSQMYRYDGTSVNNTVASSAAAANVPTSAAVSSNELFNDVDLLARRHGQSVDFLGTLSAGYAKDFPSNSAGDLSRVSIASIELSDRTLGTLVRLGRQVRNEDGILGTFDGLFASYQFLPAFALNVSAGYPVELLNASVQTAHRFESVGLAVAPPGSHWDADVFAETQQFDGVRDRQAVGFEARYLASFASLVALTDYDLDFHTLNTAALIGTLQLPARWSLSVDAERRNAPELTTSNALIGQPVTTIAQLEQVFTLTQIYQLARDRTPVTSLYSITATRPLGERFQFSVTAEADQTGATPASGGVDAQPATGLNHIVEVQLYGTSILRTGDFGVLNAQYGNTEVGQLESLGVTSRFPVVSAWRVGPRLTVDRQTVNADGSQVVTFIPSVLIDYQSEHKLLQIELGGELGKRDAALQIQNTTRLYASIAYRISF